MKDILIQGTLKLVVRYAACDLVEHDRYHFYSQLPNDPAYAPTGDYHDFVTAMAANFKTVSNGLTLKEAFSAENIRKMLKKSGRYSCQSCKDRVSFEYVS